jgi:hypothetical protein
MTSFGALQDQELMTEGKNFSLSSGPSSEAGSDSKKQGDEKGKHGSDSLHTASVQTQPLQ